jgi:two-component system chemotaxis response regulator CheY
MNEPLKKVLIVDDSVVIRKAIEKFLSDAPLKIIGKASNGSMALELFREHKPDIVTLDITMPGLDGFQTLKEMIRINQSSKIIVITALADKATGLRALKYGAKSYLTKPFGPEKLQEAFSRLLD